jgi:gamma-glutamyl-gamma-aminobutyrate hydrolase PuuD
MTRSAPLVGVTTYYAEASWGPWHCPAFVVPAPYVELVAAAGGRTLLIPPVRSSLAGPGVGALEAIDALDALVVVGGGDIDPESYGEPAHSQLGGVDGARDQSELALVAAALDAELPVLAICRGLQVLNVHLGGTLVQHVPDMVGHTGHQPAAGAFGDIDIVTVPGTALATIMGETDTVRCSHHQAIGELGKGLVVSARSVERSGPVGTDGIIEAVELDGAPFVLGVQWHPEESGDRRLFDALMSASRP